MKAKDIMMTDVVSVSPETTVKEVAKILFENHISGVPVIDREKKILGIITEGDLVARDSKLRIPDVIQILDSFFYTGGTKEFEQEFRKITAIKAKELMTARVVTANEDTSVEDLATIMTEKRVNPIPVATADGTLVGIVSRSDIIWLLAREELKTRSKHAN